MNAHPVRLRVTVTERPERVHLAIRAVLLLALGALGFGSLGWVCFLALPALAALLLAHKGANRYFLEDAPWIVGALRWITSAYAYLWLLTDELPTSRSDGRVQLNIACGGTPSPRSALLRLLFTLPALVLLALLRLAAALCWIVGAISILLRRRLPAAIADFLQLTLRFELRALAYHLSLVDRYPSIVESMGHPLPIEES